MILVFLILSSPILFQVPTNAIHNFLTSKRKGKANTNQQNNTHSSNKQPHRSHSNASQADSSDLQSNKDDFENLLLIPSLNTQIPTSVEIKQELLDSEPLPSDVNNSQTKLRPRKSVRIKLDLPPPIFLTLNKKKIYPLAKFDPVTSNKEKTWSPIQVKPEPVPGDSGLDSIPMSEASQPPDAAGRLNTVSCDTEGTGTNENQVSASMNTTES